jgi:hypothetical protein
VALSEHQTARSSVSTLVVRQRIGNGTWLQLGGALNVNPAAEINDVSVAVSGDQISVAWMEKIGDTQTTIMKRWNAATQTWIPFGAFVNTGSNLGFNQGLALALDSGGGPLVAFTQMPLPTGLGNLFVKQWAECAAPAEYCPVAGEPAGRRLRLPQGKSDRAERL